MHRGRKPENVAEQLAASWMKAVHGARDVIVAARSNFQRQDIWASDVAGFVGERLALVQVTTGKGSVLPARRRKLEKIGFPLATMVWLMQAEREIRWRYRIQELLVSTPAGGRIWSPWSDWEEAPDAWTAAPTKTKKKRKSAHRLGGGLGADQLPPAVDAKLRDKMSAEEFRAHKRRRR